MFNTKEIMKKLEKQFEALFTTMPCELRELKGKECAQIFIQNLEKFTEWQNKMMCYSVNYNGEILWKYGGVPDIQYTTEEIMEQFMKG